jgi:hypothetical protein
LRESKEGVPVFDVDQKILPSVKSKVNDADPQVRMVDKTPHFCTMDTIGKLPEFYGLGCIDIFWRNFRGPIRKKAVTDLIRESFSGDPKVERECRCESLPSGITPFKPFQHLVIRRVWSMNIWEPSTVDGKFNEELKSH